MKIGIFDSGMGGITVFSELYRALQSVSFVYYGDTAHLPYGGKSPSQIKKLTLQGALALKEKGIDALVIACNTATSWALEDVRRSMGPIPIFGVVEPGVDAVLSAALGATASEKESLSLSPVVVFATRATVKSGAYRIAFEQRLKAGLRQELPSIPSFYEQSCPLLVPFIEEGWIHHPILDQVIREYVGPYLSLSERGIALLGCTHYPWIHAQMEAAMPGWQVINSAQAVAQAVLRDHEFQRLLIQSKTGISNSASLGSTSVEWIFTDPEVLPQIARTFIADFSGSNLQR